MVLWTVVLLLLTGAYLRYDQDGPTLGILLVAILLWVAKCLSFVKTRQVPADQANLNSTHIEAAKRSIETQCSRLEVQCNRTDEECSRVEAECNRIVVDCTRIEVNWHQIEDVNSLLDAHSSQLEACGCKLEAARDVLDSASSLMESCVCILDAIDTIDRDAVIAHRIESTTRRIETARSRVTSAGSVVDAADNQIEALRRRIFDADSGRSVATNGTFENHPAPPMYDDVATTLSVPEDPPQYAAHGGIDLEQPPAYEASIRGTGLPPDYVE